VPIEIVFKNRVTLYSELTLLQKVNNSEFSFFYTNYNTTTNIKNTENFIELPILLKYYLPSEKIKIYFLSGPSIGYLLSSSRKRVYKSFDVNTNELIEESKINSRTWGGT